MTTTYTPAQRKAIARAFKAAKPYLWDGKSTYQSYHTKFTCIAIGYACRNRHIQAEDTCLARQVIEERIYPQNRLDSWLHVEGGVPLEDLTYARLQKHRHEWLDLLIAEFSD